MSFSPCASCRRLVHRVDVRCRFCARRGTLVPLTVAALIVAGCESTMQPIVVEAPPNDPTIDAGPKWNAPPPTASSPPTTERTPRRRNLQIEPVYGGPPPPLEEEIV